MPRVCARMGCGVQIQFDRFFCGEACKNSDKSEKMRLRRHKERAARFALEKRIRERVLKELKGKK